MKFRSTIGLVLIFLGLLVFNVGCKEKSFTTPERIEVGDVLVLTNRDVDILVEAGGASSVDVFGPDILTFENCTAPVPSQGQFTVAPDAPVTRTATVSPDSTGAFCCNFFFMSRKHDGGTSVCGRGIDPDIALSTGAGEGLADGQRISFTDDLNPRLLSFIVSNEGFGALNLEEPFFDDVIGATASVETPLGSLLLETEETATFTVEILASGAWSAALHLPSDDADEAPFVLLLDGDPTAPELVVPATVTVPDGQEDQTQTHPLELAAMGPTPVSITGITFTHLIDVEVDFTAPAPSFPLELDTVAAPTLDITPLAPSYSFNVVITSDDPASPHVIAFSGGAVDPRPDLTVSHLGAGVAHQGHVDVGEVSTLAASTATYNISNASFLDLIVGTVTIDNAVNLRAHPTWSFLSPTTTLTGQDPPLPLEIRYEPAAAGVFSFDVSIASNDPDTPFTFTHRGTGLGHPGTEVRYQGELLDEASVLTVPGGAGAEFQVELDITNLGPGDLEISGFFGQARDNVHHRPVVMPAPLVAPNAHTPATMAYTPILPGPFSFEIAIDSNGRSWRIPVNGIAASVPDLEVSYVAGQPLGDGDTLDIGAFPPGVESELLLLAENVGTEHLTHLAASVTTEGNVAAFFAAGATTLGIDGTTLLTGAVTPQTPGPFSFDLVLASNDPDENPLTIHVVGEVPFEADIRVQREGSTLVDGGTDDVGPNAPGTLELVYTIENVGASDLLVDAPSLGALVNVDAVLSTFTPATLAPGETAPVTLTVTPDTLPTSLDWSVELVITSNDPDETPFDLAIIGSTPRPELEVRYADQVIEDGGTITLPDAMAGQGTELLLSVENIGLATLGLSAATVSHAINAHSISVLPILPDSVDPGADLVLVVTFVAPAAGPSSFTLTLDNNDFDEGLTEIHVATQAIELECLNEPPVVTGLGDFYQVVHTGVPGILDRNDSIEAYICGGQLGATTEGSVDDGLVRITDEFGTEISAGIVTDGDGTTEATGLAEGTYFIVLDDDSNSGTCEELTITATVDGYASFDTAFSAAPAFDYGFSFNPHLPFYLWVNPPQAGEETCPLLFTSTVLEGIGPDGLITTVLDETGALATGSLQTVDGPLHNGLRTRYHLWSDEAATLVDRPTIEVQQHGTGPARAVLDTCSNLTLGYERPCDPDALCDLSCEFPGCDTHPSCATNTDCADPHTGEPPNGYEPMFFSDAGLGGGTYCIRDTCGNWLDPEGPILHEKNLSTGSPNLFLGLPMATRPWLMPVGIPVEIVAFASSDYPDTSMPTCAAAEPFGTEIELSTTMPQPAAHGARNLVSIDANEGVHFFETDCEAPTDGSTLLRVINMSPGVPLLRLTYQEPGFSTVEEDIITNVPFGTASPYTTFPASLLNSAGFAQGFWRYYGHPDTDPHAYQAVNGIFGGRGANVAHAVHANSCQTILVTEDPLDTATLSTLMMDDPVLCEVWDNYDNPPLPPQVQWTEGQACY